MQGIFSAKTKIAPISARIAPMIMRIFPKLAKGDILSPFSQIPFLLAVDATAVALTVQIDSLRFLNTLFPSIAKVLIEKMDSNLLADRFSDGLD